MEMSETRTWGRTRPRITRASAAEAARSRPPRTARGDDAVEGLGDDRVVGGLDDRGEPRPGHVVGSRVLARKGRRDPLLPHRGRPGPIERTSLRAARGGGGGSGLMCAEGFG